MTVDISGCKTATVRCGRDWPNAQRAGLGSELADRLGCPIIGAGAHFPPVACGVTCSLELLGGQPLVTKIYWESAQAFGTPSAHTAALTAAVNFQK